MKEDPHVWIQPSIEIYGTNHYEIIFVFFNDILGMIDKGEEDTGEITNVYTANWEICK